MSVECRRIPVAFAPGALFPGSSSTGRVFNEGVFSTGPLDPGRISEHAKPQTLETLNARNLEHWIYLPLFRGSRCKVSNPVAWRQNPSIL